MPKKASKKKSVKTQRRAVARNLPRPLPSARANLIEGISGIANQFMPGAGLALRGISKLTGFGAYTSAEADSILASRVPTMNATLDRGVRVSHHEFLGDVKSTTDFTVLKYPLNPGMSETFPWLSIVAQAFQEYELNGCIFYFKSTSANALNSTNTALGQIIGAVQYNPYQPDPLSKVTMLGLSSASDGKPSESNLFPVECKADMILMRSKLIRTAEVTDDKAKYDHGNFYLGSNGSQASAVVGELHVVYDITLKKPKLYSTSSQSKWFYHEFSRDTTAITSATPLGGATTVLNNLGVERKDNVIVIPASVVDRENVYRVCLRYDGGPGSPGTNPSIVATNASATFYYLGSASYLTTAVSGSLSNEVYFRPTVSKTPIQITIGTSSVLPANPSWDLSIHEVLV